MKTVGLPLTTTAAYSSRRRFSKAYIFYDCLRGYYQVCYNSKIVGYSKASMRLYTYNEANALLLKIMK